MPFSFQAGPIEGLVIIQPRVFPDSRGFFMETFKHADFAEAGINLPFVQDNHSSSSKNVLRGLHYQNEPNAQGKLVRVTAGTVWDVAVDIRPGSSSYGKWYGLELSAENKTMFYMPPGFAHGFVALEDGSELQYKCTAEYDAASDAGIRWDDPDLAITWPVKKPLVSEKDDALPYLKDLL